MNDSSDAELSNEYTVEQLRDSLKKSTNDLVMAANNKTNNIAEEIDRNANPANNSVKHEDVSDHSVKDEESLFSEEENRNNGDIGIDDANDIDYDTLDVSDEIKDLFKCIDAFEPADLELETPLKCFIPPYILAVGEVDPMIKISRPDGVDDGIGISRIDEVPSEQSNAAVIELQLRNYSKSKQSKQLQRAAIRKIKDAASCSGEIDEWIHSVEEIHENESQDYNIEHNSNDAVSSEKLLQSFSEKMTAEIKKNELEVPSPDIDLGLADYARVLCSLTGIPFRDGNLVESIHSMFKLYLKISDVEYNSDISFPIAS